MSLSDKPASSGERLQKIIAQAGLASRRDAEELIREGRVTVNGKTASLGDKALLGKDAIKVRGKLIHSTEQKVYYLLYKPKNVISSLLEDEEGRPTLKEFAKRIPERVFTVGKMDFTGEGLILLTNDGAVAQRLQKANDIIRRFHVKVDRHPTNAELEKLSRGGRLEGRSMHPVHVRLANAYAKNSLIEISFEGTSAIDIRKFFENKGFYPERIATVGIGHIAADKMLPGTIKKIEGSSVEALFAQPELAKKLIEKLVAKKTHVKTLKAADEKANEPDADATRATRTERKSFTNEAVIRPAGIKIRPVNSEAPAFPAAKKSFAKSAFTENNTRLARGGFAGERKSFVKPLDASKDRGSFAGRSERSDRAARPATSSPFGGADQPSGRKNARPEIREPKRASFARARANPGSRPARPTIRAKRS